MPRMLKLLAGGRPPLPLPPFAGLTRDVLTGLGGPGDCLNKPADGPACRASAFIAMTTSYASAMAYLSTAIISVTMILGRRESKEFRYVPPTLFRCCLSCHLACRFTHVTLRDGSSFSTALS